MTNGGEHPLDEGNARSSSSSEEEPTSNGADVAADDPPTGKQLERHGDRPRPANGVGEIEIVEDEMAELVSELEDIPQVGQLAKLLLRFVELIRRRSYSGLLPPPEFLEAYQDVYPDAGRIIFQDLEAQGQHRRSVETFIVQRQERRADRGQVFAFVLGICALGAAAAVLLTGGSTIGASVLFGATLLALVTGFLRYRHQGDQDLHGPEVHPEPLTPRPDDSRPAPRQDPDAERSPHEGPGSGAPPT